MNKFIKLFTFVAAAGFIFAACSTSSSDEPNVDAQAPVINLQPKSAAYDVGDAAAALIVSASVDDRGAITFQWYSGTSSSDNGKPVSGAKSASYTPSTAAEGKTYYCCRVMNTNNNVSGTKSVMTYSSPAIITVGKTAVVNAAAPVITAQPVSAVYDFKKTADSLIISAKSSDSGNLSYQWYSAANASDAGTIIAGATGTAYKPSTAAVGTVYYYCVVTNTITDNGDGGTKSAAAVSNVIYVKTNKIVNAETPSITVQPVSATYTKGDSAAALSVTASVADGGTLSYQWYSKTTAEGSGAELSGETKASYMPATAAVGTVYYYCVVTNTNSSVNGTTTASAFSNTATIIVNKPAVVNAAAPVITVQPVSASYNAGDSAAALTVSATVSDGGTLSYQWYKNSAAVGTDSASYSPATDATGSYTYYCVVTNTITDNGDGGSKSAVAASSSVTVTVAAIVNAETPVISAVSENAAYKQGDTASALSVTVNSVSDGGTLSLQWYSADSQSGAGTVLSAETGSTYTPSTAAAGTKYYYVTATNTNNTVNGNKTVAATSSRVTVQVVAVVNAAAPTLSANITGATYSSNATAAALSVTASVTDGGTLSYQWYSASSETAAGTAISGAVNSSYTPSTLTAGTVYYYVVVTNTNTAVNGSSTATVMSNRAAVVVSSDKITLKCTAVLGDGYSMYFSGTFTEGNAWATAVKGTYHAGDIWTIEVTMPAAGSFKWKAIKASSSLGDSFTIAGATCSWQQNADETYPSTYSTNPTF